MFFTHACIPPSKSWLQSSNMYCTIIIHNISLASLMSTLTFTQDSKWKKKLSKSSTVFTWHLQQAQTLPRTFAVALHTPVNEDDNVAILAPSQSTMHVAIFTQTIFSHSDYDINTSFYSIFLSIIIKLICFNICKTKIVINTCIDIFISFQTFQKLWK